MAVDAGSERERRRPVEDSIKLALVVLALAISSLVLWDLFRGRPVPAAFTRIGGPTRVETAVEASYFWLDRPRHVVTVGARAKTLVIWEATWCALLHDAPLFFVPSGEQRRRLVEAAIDRWDTPPQRIEIPEEWCPPDGRDLSNVDGVSTLAEVRRVQRLPFVDTARRLAPFVVFASVKRGRDQPDVAIALVLAAHMADEDRDVSVVVLPRYVQAAPRLEKALRERRELVRSGVVLGQTGVLSEDTRNVLRQILTSVDRQGIFDELRTVLGSVEALVAVLLGLAGLGVAAGTVPHIAEQRAARTRNRTERRPLMARMPNVFGVGRPETGADRLTDLENKRVTVTVRSGSPVEGEIAGVVELGKVTFIRLENAKAPSDDDAPRERRGVILVPIDAVELLFAAEEKSSPSDPPRGK